MNFNYKGTEDSTESVVIKDPGYALWYIDELPASNAGKAFARHIAKLDAKGFVEKCTHCDRTATHSTAYQGMPDLYFWCANCDPYGQGAVRGKLRDIRTYREAVAHIAMTAQGHKDFTKQIVRNLAVGKGLTDGRLTQKALQAFF